MARQLGIKRCWFHAGEFTHYDIPKRRFKEFERLRVCEDLSSRFLKVTQREILKIIKAAQ